ncbi:hypothetical protein MRX96_047537 [Rhipicephalus microplus]
MQSKVGKRKDDKRFDLITGSTTLFGTARRPRLRHGVAKAHLFTIRLTIRSKFSCAAPQVHPEGDRRAIPLYASSYSPSNKRK